MYFGQLDELYNEKEFIRSLTETIALCSGLHAVEDFKSVLHVFLADYPFLLGPSSEVGHVADQRHEYLTANLKEPVASASSLQGGRLMIYSFGGTDSSGAAAYDSEGFFNVYSAPPMATWVWYVKDDSPTERWWSEFVVAWVPPTFLELADDGMAVDPTECICWLDTLDIPFAHSVRRLNLLP